MSLKNLLKTSCLCKICNRYIDLNKDKYIYIKTRRKTEFLIHEECLKKEM